jgi:integrase
MGNRKRSGLIDRDGIWHIEKRYRGVRIRESTKTSEIRKAEEHLARRIEEIRQSMVFGIRPDRPFRVAATKFLEENQHKRSIGDDAMHLQMLDPFIGDLPLRLVHKGTLQEFIGKRKKDGVKTSTINQSLAVVRHILNLAAEEWKDERGVTWLEHAEKIKLLPVEDQRPPYPLSREEQAVFFQELPDYYQRMALFKVNTGTREEEVCVLEWADEVQVPELNTSVFIIPGHRVKNKQDRLIVLNRVARAVIDSVRGQHPTRVFVRIPKPLKVKPGRVPIAREPVTITRMNSTAWRNARRRAADKWEARTGEPAAEGFRRVRVHDLKHTFGRRLRAARVPFEDRQDLLGHKSKRITTHYSAAELAELIAAAERVCDDNAHNSPAVTLLRRRAA